MAENILLEIIRRCLALEEKAVRAYSLLSETSPDDLMCDFWDGMSREEQEHVGYWKRLMELAGDGLIPQIIDEPYDILRELEDLDKKSDALLERTRDVSGVTASFVLAFRLEFYLMHPAFMRFFHFLTQVPGEKSPEAEYETHLKKFIQALERHGSVTPELELLAETIQTFWRENQRLVIESTTDYLTGVLNRRGLFNAIKPLSHLAARQEYTVGLFIIDVDNFKRINDSFGHQKGDEVLRGVAAILSSILRQSDVIGRYGGEEFMVFLSDTDHDELVDIAEKLRKKVERNTADHVPVTVSIGVKSARFRGEVERDLEEAIKKADENLYRAKEAGRNKIYSS